MLTFLKLNLIKKISDSICLKADQNGYEFLVISHDNFDAAFALHGGHLIHFQEKQKEPVIFLSQTAIFNDQKAIRGGVPICWPWFGDPPPLLGDNLPSHGFARTSKWTIENTKELEEGVVVEFKLTHSEESLKLWPYRFTLYLKATLTNKIKLELETVNNDIKPFSYGGALHSYLNISFPGDCELFNLPKKYIDLLEDKVEKVSNGLLHIDKAIDSIYESSIDHISLKDLGFDRTIKVSNKGNDSQVIWNPWIEGAKAFIDMPDDGYKRMICIESAICKNIGVVIPAGRSHTLSTVISSN